MKLSVFLPTIRTHLLDEFLEFLRRSYSGDLEVVLAGPFCPMGSDCHCIEYLYPKAYNPEELLNEEGKIKVKWYQTFQSPTCAAQQAALACTGDLILHSVDDTLYLPGALDELVESFDIYEGNQVCNELSYAPSPIVFNAPYCDSPEGYRELQKNKVIHPDKFKHPSYYWTASNAGYGGLPNIDPNWMTTCHFLMRKEQFLKYGGFDCQFEYLNHACHDLLFRMYLDGVRGYSLDETVSLADWVPDRQGDHGPINDAQLFHDHPAFLKKWATIPELKINPFNYKNYPDIWERRFNKGGQKEYGELGYA